MLCIFLTGVAYAPYATCMAMPLLRTTKNRVKLSKIVWYSCGRDCTSWLRLCPHT